MQSPTTAVRGRLSREKYKKFAALEGTNNNLLGSNLAAGVLLILTLFIRFT